MLFCYPREAISGLAVVFSAMKDMSLNYSYIFTNLLHCNFTRYQTFYNLIQYFLTLSDSNNVAYFTSFAGIPVVSHFY